MHTSRVQAPYPLHPKQSKDVDEEQIEEGDVAQLVQPTAKKIMETTFREWGGGGVVVGGGGGG